MTPRRLTAQGRAAARRTLHATRGAERTAEGIEFGADLPISGDSESDAPHSSSKTIASCGGSQVASRASHEIVISLPLPPKECSPNWSGKLRDRIRAKREAREWAMYATIKAMETGVGWGHVRASAHFTFAVRRTRDDDNLLASLKAYRDGIAGVLWGDDSGWKWDGPPTVTIGPNEGVVITVRPVEGAV